MLQNGPAVPLPTTMCVIFFIKGIVAKKKNRTRRKFKQIGHTLANLVGSVGIFYPQDLIMVRLHLAGSTAVKKNRY